MLFEGLNVATRGLSAAQLGINITGQNITNATTEGYSRKRLEQASEWRRDGSYGQMGFGVEVYSINRIRDQFIDRLTNEENTRYGYYTMKDAAFNRIESVFYEPSEHALNSLLNNFWSNWADVENNPNSAGARETLRSTAQTLTGQFNYVATQLRSYKDTINDEIEARINTVNEISSAIHRCNVVICGSEGALGNNANDTRDQRDRLLGELAQLIDVDYYEEENGVLMVSTNGHMLVSAAKNHELVVKRSEVKEEDGYEYSRVEVSFSTTGKEYKPKLGELKALMDIRDVDIPEYERYVNELAKTLITGVNEIHQNGYALSGLTFIDFFDSDPNKLNAANMDISQAIKNDINNVAAGSGGKKVNVPNIEATGPQSVTSTHSVSDIFINKDYTDLEILDSNNNVLVLGTDYIIEDSPSDPHHAIIKFINSAIPGPEVTLNTTYAPNSPYVVSNLVSPLVANSNATPPTYSHQALDLTTIDPKYRYIYKNSLEISVRGADGNMIALQEGKDYDIDYNSAQIIFKYNSTSNAFDDVTGTQVYINFNYHETGFGGPGDGDNALAIAQLKDKAIMQSDVFGKSTQTINQFYAGMLGRLGVERNEAKAALDTRTFALQQLKTRQDEIAGVNLDEEVANLIQYQHTYQASARYLSTINTMLDTLLNM